MTPGLRSAVSAGLLTVLACCTQQPGGEVSGLGLCASVEQRANNAFRSNFLTDYQTAERAWTDILALYESRAEDLAGCRDIPTRSIVLANLGLVYSNQRNFTAANGMLDASAKAESEAARGRTEIYRALHDLNRSAVGDATLQRAEQSAVSAKSSEGLRLLERDLNTSVLQLSRRAQRVLIEESVNLAALAFAYLSRDRLDDALNSIDAALARVAPIDGAAASYVPRFTVTKAEILLARGDNDAALSAVQSALRGYGADMRRSALMGRAEIVHGRVLTALGRNDRALDAYKKGFDILKDVTIRVSYDLLWPYVELADRVMAQAPSRRAQLTEDLFKAAQVVRSQVTASAVSLAAQSAAEGEGALADAVRRLNRASEELALVVAQKLLVDGRGTLAGDNTRAAVDRLFEEARAREDAARQAVLAIEPDYFDRISGTAGPGDLQQVLETDEAYVQIIPGDPESLVFLVRPDTVRMLRVAELNRAETTAIVARLREIVRGQLIYEPNLSHQLYQAFLQPLEADLAGAEALIFSNADALTALPMEVVAAKESPINDLLRLDDFTDVEWLADRYRISYVPSPRNLVDLRRAEAVVDEPRPVIAFGDFQPGADVNEILAQSFLPEECGPIAQAISLLPPLEGTRDEVAAVGEIFGANSVVVEGAAFTEQRIQSASESGELEKFGILHFATHGLLPNGDCVRRPALSVSAAGVEGSDGLLTDIEIRRLSLDADLVVLSACDTAGALDTDFNAAGGEALSGLARAFFDAGTRSLFATHWPVTDDITAAMVRRFYGGLREGKSMTASLGEAQRLLRKTQATSDPIFWGAFVMIGHAERPLARP